MSGFVANELSAFCGDGESAQGVARSRFPIPVELAAIRKADRGDDWADFLAWPV